MPVRIKCQSVLSSAAATMHNSTNGTNQHITNKLSSDDMQRSQETSHTKDFDMLMTFSHSSSSSCYLVARYLNIGSFFSCCLNFVENSSFCICMAYRCFLNLG
jgi:hypothetical protein